MTTTCLRCQRPRRIHGRGLCEGCHKSACQNGTLDRYPISDYHRKARERAQVIADHLRSGLTRTEVIALMGVSADTVNGVARRHGIPTIPQPDGTPPPTDPACAGTNHPGFIVETSPNRRVSAEIRNLIGEALTYCDRCPTATRDWCRALINPTRTRWTGIAGGEVYVDGEHRPELALEAVS